MKRNIIRVLTVSVALASMAILATAEVPQNIYYQGRLTDNSEPVADGSYSITFRIYTAAAGGSELWSSGERQVPVTDGLIDYQLGDSVALPDDLFSVDTTRYLGITVTGNPEMYPRTKITSVAYAYQALRADTAGYAVSVADGSVGSSQIQNGSIEFIDIGNNGASEDQVMKFKGGAWVAYADSTGAGATDHGELEGLGDYDHDQYQRQLDDNVLYVGQCVVMGQTWSGNQEQLLYLEPDWNTSDRRRAIYARAENDGNGETIGIEISTSNAIGASGDRYGIDASAGSSSNTGGVSYGVYGSARGGTEAQGVRGYASGASGRNYAGKFMGDVDINGTVSKDGGSFRIDHPLDPANKYLQHSFVESPDMMNVYNGNVTLNGTGEATVDLPEYFDALNMDFRYQLTAIGAPGPNLYIAREVSSNSFDISGGESGMKVSWQVTGIRHDKWAEQNRIQVEVEKLEHERGLYRHPELHGFGVDKAIDPEPDRTRRSPR